MSQSTIIASTNSKASKLPHNIIKDYTNVEANQYIVHLIGQILIKLGFDVTRNETTAFSFPLFAVIFMTHTLMLNFIISLFTDVPLAKMLEGVCVSLIIYQGIHKMYSLVLYPESYFHIFKMIRNLNIKYQDDKIISWKLKKISINSTIVFELMAITYFAILFAYMILPAFMWIRHNELTTMLPFQFPFIDWHTTVGYVINNLHHLINCTMGCTGLISSDIIFFFFILHTIGYFEILKSRIHKLDVLLETEPHDIEAIHLQLINCIQAHQDYIGYIQLLDIIYAPISLSQLGSDELILTLSLFLTMWSKLIVAPFLVIGSMFQILEFCILGTVVTIQNEKVSETIYGMKWYLLPVDCQKMVLLMIMRGQSSPELNVGGFAKLNVATCMQVFKTTYSYLMMMLEFLG